MALISPEERLVHLEFCKQGQMRIPPGNYTGYNSNVFFTPSADDGPLMPCFSLPWEGEIAALDGAGSLFRFSALKGESKSIGSKPLAGTLHLIATDVLAVNVVNSRLVYVGREWPDNQFRIVSIGQNVSRNTPVEEKALRAFFGPPSNFAHPEFGLLALEQTKSQWVIFSVNGPKVLVKPIGAKVFGVFVDERSNLDAGLLALQDDLKTVTLSGLTGPTWQRELFCAHAPVQHIALCQRAPHIAYSTVDGEIVIYSLRHGVDLCRYLPEGAK